MANRPKRAERISYTVNTLETDEPSRKSKKRRNSDSSDLSSIGSVLSDEEEDAGWNSLVTHVTDTNLDNQSLESIATCWETVSVFSFIQTHLKKSFVCNSPVVCVLFF